MQDSTGTASGALALVDDPLFSRHEAEVPHPERPERLDAARAALARADLTLPRLELAARDATDDELARVHTPGYVETLGQTAGKRGYFDADTFYGPESSAAARRAAGGSIAIVDALLSGEAAYALGLLRPPGHHARPGSAMGFCLLNNVAIAAAHARSRGAERVAIVDWDVHHGNGTQEMFYDDASVLYVSLHQAPFYPGTGDSLELGEGEGRGHTLNIPLSKGADDRTYLAAFDRIVAPVIAQYDPDLLLISAGFDAHLRDPLAEMRLDDAAYARMLARLMRAMPRGARGRLALLLEGGYDLKALSGSLIATLRALDGELPEPARRRDPDAGHADDVERAQRAAAQHWMLD